MVLALTVVLLLAYNIFSLINYFLYLSLFDHRVATKGGICRLARTVLGYYETEVLAIY
jgi:hypothetical protein